MQPTSLIYNAILAKPEHTFIVELTISDTDGSNPQTFGMDKLFNLKTDCRVFGSSYSIGGCYSSTCEFSLLGDGSTIPRMAKCEITYKVTDGINTSEAINKGTYYIDTREVETGPGGISVFNAFCYDTMIFSNKKYAPSGMRWPATDTAVIADICSQLGITADSRNSNQINQSYTLGAPSGRETIQDYLSYIAVMYGGNWVITDDNKLRFLRPVSSANPGYDPVDITDADVTNFTRGRFFRGYTMVKIWTSDNTYITAGSDETMALDVRCPFATQAVADNLYNFVGEGLGGGYFPFSATGVYGDPAVELGDSLSIQRGNTGYYYLSDDNIYSRVITFGSKAIMELSAPNDTEADHEISYVAQNERDLDELSEDVADMYDTVADGLRNLIINTKVPSVTNLPALYGQLGATYFQNYTPTPAVHGIRFTKDTSSSSSVLFAFGETSNTSMFASMCGLEAGEAYTLSFDWSYTLFAASSDETYMRWQLLSWDSTSSGATLTRTEFMREPITRNTATSKPGVKGTFVVPEDAVVLCVYMDFITSSGGVDTVIANSAVRSTDYYEFANFMMQKGVNATEWTAAPEDDDTLGVGTTFIDSSGIDRVQLNDTGLEFFDSNGATTFTYPAGGLSTKDLLYNTRDGISTSGTTKTYTLQAPATYLVTTMRSASSSTTQDGMWLVASFTSSGSSHMTTIKAPSGTTTCSISGSTLTITTGSANVRVTITRLD